MDSKQRYFIGIDISTTGSKAVVIDQQGTIVAAQSYAHELHTPRPLWAEQNPSDWWDTTCRVLRQVLRTAPAEQIAAVGLTGQMLGLTVLDGSHQPLRPAILWNDQRSGAQCESMTELVGPDLLHRTVGSRLLPGLVAPKLVWLREHEPEVYRKIRRVMLPKDYIRFRLSGAHTTDVSDGSGFALMDVGKRAWSDEMLAAIDIPRDWLPDLCESPEVVAHVSDEGAASTGLRVGTPIVGGAGDQPAQAIGSGIAGHGQTSLTVGTSGVGFTVADRYAPDPDGRFHTFCHAIPGFWCYISVMLSAAGSLRWLRDALSSETSFETLSDIAAEIPRGSLGLLFAPYLSGERHPYPDPLARGAFIGLTLRHSFPHMVRAVMESTAFGMLDNIRLVAAQGIPVTAAAISGGAANSPVWRQLMSDIMNIPLYTVNDPEGAALGAALLAAVGTGEWPDVPTACAELIHRVDEIVPEPAGVAAYERLYPIFRNLYPELRSTFEHLAEFEAGGLLESET